jgi:hypothetical protein
MLLTWHLSRRPARCPDCHTTLVWERKAHVRLWTGILLVAVFAGVLLGASLAPQIGVLLGFASPQSVDDPFWNTWLVRATEIGSVVLTLAAFTMMVFGFLKYRLVRYDAA